MLARFTCALHRWQACLDAAAASAAVAPFPEVLGYEVDAQRALGDPAAAARTDDLIRTVERIGNAQHISDRLLAVYYTDHGERRDDAYAIAKRELAVRDDVFTEDTLAWAAAMDGRWYEARARIRRALRYVTENALLRYHAGIIALHFGDRVEARRDALRRAWAQPRVPSILRRRRTRETERAPAAVNARRAQKGAPFPRRLSFVPAAAADRGSARRIGLTDR